MLETCRGSKKTYHRRNCASSWLPTRKNLQSCRQKTTIRRKINACSMKMCFFDGVKTRNIIWLFSGGYRCSHCKETFNGFLLNTKINPDGSYSHVTYLGPHILYRTGLLLIFNMISSFNPLNAKLNPICHLLALLGAHHILHISRIRVNIHGSVHHSMTQ